MALDFPNSPTNGQTYGNYYYDASVGTSGAWRANPIPVGGLPAGSIIQWGSNTAPANWLICDGSAVSRTVYPSLFAAIGTQYGAGDGSTTFNLPDLRGRVAVGKNSGTFGTLGATGGAETVALSGGPQLSMTSLPTAMRTIPGVTNNSGSTNIAFAYYNTSAGGEASRVVTAQTAVSTTNLVWAYINTNNSGSATLPANYATGSNAQIIWVSAEL